MVKKKTQSLNIRLEPQVNETLRVAAERERRSVSNMVEVMILTYAKWVEDAEGFTPFLFGKRKGKAAE